MADIAQTLEPFEIEEDLDLSPRPARSGRVKVDRRLSRELKREASYYAKLIPDILAEIGYDHWIRKENRPAPIAKLVLGKQSRQKVRIIHAAYNEAAIYLRVDPLRLPYRVTIPMLQEEEVLETLSVACGCKVTFQLRDYANGSWFVVHRDGVISSIPREFAFRDAINTIRPGARPLVYTAGIAENMRLIQPDIEEMPHMLVAGSPGMGKSVCLNAIICQLMWRNSPDIVKFAMVDLKGGMELQDYRSVPYLWKPIVTTIDDTIPMLQDFKKEMKRRQGILSDAGARSIRQYNAHRQSKMPYLIMIIDELAEVLRNPQSDLSNKAMLELGSILSVARATGGHCILCTQRPSVDVISGYLKATISTRVAFSVPTQADSRTILDSHHAADLDLPGRAWMLNGSHYVQIQSPIISPALIQRTIDEVCKREEARIKPTVSIEELVQISLARCDGWMTRHKLKPELGDRMGWDQLQKLLIDLDGQVVGDGNGNLYQVLNLGRGNGRRLELVELQTNMQEQASELQYAPVEYDS